MMTLIAAKKDPLAMTAQDHGQQHLFRRLENTLLSFILAAMVLLPLTEAVLRKFDTGLAGGSALLQHLTLSIGMLGAAVAARDGKLLSLFSLTSLASGRWRMFGRWLSHGYGSAVSGLLCYASLQLVWTEREAGQVLAYRIPVWTVQLVLPISFALIAWHLARQASEKLRDQLILVSLLTLLAMSMPEWARHADTLWLPILAAIALCAVAGAPIFAILGGVPLLLFWREDSPIAAVALDHYSMVVNPSLPAIPLFTLAGFLLAAGHAPDRLTRLFKAWFGHFRGGVAVATVSVGAFFTAFTGASGVTILALGGVLLPLLVKADYRERDAVGLVTVSGSLGVLLAPCLTLILYAIVAKIGIERMFLGAIFPALLMIVLIAGWGVSRDTRNHKHLIAFNWGEAWHSLRGACWELGLTVVVFFGLFGGYATPVEASALTALYVLLVEALVFRDLRSLPGLVAIGAECGSLVGGLLLILGVALGFTNYLVDIGLPERLVDWVTATIHSRWVFLLMLNGLLLLVGCVMEVFAAIVIVPPLLVPVGLSFGLDPVHLGVIFLANLELGFLTPLVGINLFYASSRFNKPVLEVCRSVLPLFPILAAGVLAITYLPWLSTVLPGLWH